MAETMKILLVEDSDDIRDAFTGLLRAEGAYVVAVETGGAAIAAALREDFDILLTDYGLPDIPGDFLIRQVFAIARRRPRVIVITGYGEPYTGWARLAGAELVLTKPVEWVDLLAHLRPDPRRIAA
jgi:two-component system, chemotaxis family, CheB/CheR fusion protein